MLFIYFWLTLNWGFDRNSACTYLKSHQACWAADKGLGISPQGCGEYRQEARDPAPDQNFLRGGWSRARHPARTLQSKHCSAPRGVLGRGTLAPTLGSRPSQQQEGSWGLPTPWRGWHCQAGTFHSGPTSPPCPTPLCSEEGIEKGLSRERLRAGCGNGIKAYANRPLRAFLYSSEQEPFSRKDALAPRHLTGLFPPWTAATGPSGVVKPGQEAMPKGRAGWTGGNGKMRRGRTGRCIGKDKVKWNFRSSLWVWAGKNNHCKLIYYVLIFFLRGSSLCTVDYCRVNGTLKIQSRCLRHLNDIRVKIGETLVMVYKYKTVSGLETFPLL